MLEIVNSLGKLRFGMLMEVYAESNREKGAAEYPWETEDSRILQAEQDFYQYLRECFFVTPGAFYAVWICRGRYVSALRMEPFRDGLLLEALETAPKERGRGYATLLISAVLERLEGQKVYSHIHKKNVASLRTHEKCGFQKILDYAVYADGSVLNSSVTLCIGK